MNVSNFSRGFVFALLSGMTSVAIVQAPIFIGATVCFGLMSLGFFISHAAEIIVKAIKDE